MRHRFARSGLLAVLVGLSPAAQAGTPPAPATDAQRFCQNAAAAAADARFALQTRKLNELQGAIAKRVAALEAKEAEVKALLDAHEDAKKRAEASLVAIYAKMRREARRHHRRPRAAAVSPAAGSPARRRPVVTRALPFLLRPRDARTACAVRTARAACAICAACAVLAGCGTPPAARGPAPAL